MSPLHRSERILNPCDYTFSGQEYLQATRLRNYLDHQAVELLIDTPEEPSVSLGDQVIPAGKEARAEIDDLLTNIETTSKEVSTYTVSKSNPDADPASKPLNRHLRYLASRFIVQNLLQPTDESLPKKSHKEKWYDAAQEASDLIRTVPSTAHGLHRMDIPAYTVLYRDFDRLRLETDGGIVEVYMGRDGIFAYLGRLGQLAARGDNEPAIGAYPRSDDIASAQPKYIVYGRNIKYSTSALKRKYLLQFVDPEQNLHFFDTGFVGTAPEDALRTLGFPKRQISSRIHLLKSEESRRRQIKGLGVSINVDAIENYQKDEDTADRLLEIEDKVKYVARAQKPEDQFRFLIRRHLLLSHFYDDEYQKILTNIRP